MKRFFLKEYGSWTVFVLSLIGGWAFIKSPLSEDVLLVTLCLAILMNSKVALQGWIKRKDRLFQVAFFIEAGIAGLTILPVLPEMPHQVFFYLPVVILVFILTILGHDHKLYGELLGFAYLCLPGATIVSFSGDTEHWRVYLFLWTFYSLSVFKVRFFMRKRLLWRVMTMLSPVFAGAVIVLLGISPLYGLIRLEDTLYALGLKRKGLAYVGWTELFKALVFTCALWFTQ